MKFQKIKVNDDKTYSCFYIHKVDAGYMEFCAVGEDIAAIRTSFTKIHEITTYNEDGTINYITNQYNKMTDVRIFFEYMELKLADIEDKSLLSEDDKTTLAENPEAKKWFSGIQVKVIAYDDLKDQVQEIRETLKIDVDTLSNLTEFLSLHNVQIDAKISEAVKSSIKTVSQSADGFTLYFYTKTAPVTIEDAVFTITLPKDSAKADKVTGAVNGHLAGLDADGNLVDSGKSAADFDEAGAATKAKSEVMTYVGTIPASATAKDVVAYISEVVTKNAYDDSTLRADVNKNTAAITKLVGEGYEAIPSEKIKALFTKVTE